MTAPDDAGRTPVATPALRPKVTRRRPAAPAALQADAAPVPSQPASAEEPEADKREAPKAAPKPAAAAAPRPAAAKPAPAKPAPAAPVPSPTLPELMQAQTPEAFADLSRNLAAAVTQANTLFATAFLDQGANLTAKPDPFDVQGAMTEFWSHLAHQPDTLRDAYAGLWSRYADIWQRHSLNMMLGIEAEAPPPSRDKRFRDPEWAANPAFSLMRDTYLATADFLTDLVERTQGLDQDAKRKAAFFIKQAVDAASPSNFLLTNPAALRAMLLTRGESLKRGMENLAADMKRGKGALAITQTDMDAFKLGENVATSKGKVVFRNDVIELLQYEATTKAVHEVPLLIFPPWINKFYILDLQPKNSFIKWLTDQGHTVFVVSWANPDAALAKKTFEDYMEDGVFAAVNAVNDATRCDRVNAVGYCIGGTLLSACLAWMAAKGDQRIQSATFFAAQMDFEQAGDLRVFTDKASLAYLEGRIQSQGGVLDAQAMADTFNALRANDLIWNYVVDNYYLGNKPPPFDLLFWNADQTRMPAALHMFYLRRFYSENAMARNELTLMGEPIRLSKVKIPVYMQCSKEDHIAPAPSVFRSAKLWGGPVTYMMAGSGHIAGVINHPSANKYQHWTNDAALPATLEQWQAGAKEHPGSWWPHWDKWLRKISGPDVPARVPGDCELDVLADAPGTYVKIRS
ncbi:MAG: class I poly(R)-hydroxyalkanoic acid synthase [Hyphomonadaceae bacterium]|nr:class I poly(R)-hydroxyalkanoic acid synthase [Hyphomonadaceae bacterium]